MPVRIAYALAGAAVAAQTALYLIDVRLLNGSSGLLDLQYGDSLFSWLSTALLVVAAAFAFLSSPRWKGCTAGLLLALLALDDALQIHTRVPLWELIYFPAFVALGALLL